MPYVFRITEEAAFPYIRNFHWQHKLPPGNLACFGLFLGDNSEELSPCAGVLVFSIKDNEALLQQSWLANIIETADKDSWFLSEAITQLERKGLKTPRQILHERVQLKDLQVYPISLQSAMPYLLSEHYLHRSVSGEVATFGLFAGELGQCYGVIVYSRGTNFKLPVFLFGKNNYESYAGNCIEFSRMWVADLDIPNVESYFIAKTLKLLNKNYVIISYAQEEAGHIGTIYQATNWMYIGKGQGRYIWQLPGQTQRGKKWKKQEKQDAQDLKIKAIQSGATLSRPIRVKYGGKLTYVKIVGTRDFVKKATHDFLQVHRLEKYEKTIVSSLCSCGHFRSAHFDKNIAKLNDCTVCLCTKFSSAGYESREYSQ